MNPCSFHLVILSFIIFSPYLNPTGAATCHPDDEAGLLGFKSGITEDHFEVLSTWKKGTNCCSWDYVVCRDGDRVLEINLHIGSLNRRVFLAGTISSSLAKLKFLEKISFFNLKNITGPFPQFLSRLPHLKSVTFHGVGLSGPLPDKFGTLSNLEDISVRNNLFTGPIPDSLSVLPKLIYLDLGGNSLTGTIPSGIAKQKRIMYLSLKGNRLSGTIENIFKSMTKLQSLTLSGNNFSGSIPSYLSRFKSLQTLDLSKNHFSGEVPKSLSKLTKLVNFNISYNLLTGPIPALNMEALDIYSLTLDLSHNKFRMKTIPEWITRSSLAILKLAKCGITMRLDEWKPKKTERYETIDLSDNEITGSPAKLLSDGKLLLEFRVPGNKLRFDMEKLSFSEMLQTLDLSRNLGFGKVPVTVARLERLNLSENHLCGKLPLTKFPASTFAGNKCLCGPPLAPCKH